jgi:II/X family phage/plasmid replication protein
MIDWVSAIITCKHDPSKLISGIVMSFDAQGENEWTVNKTLSVEGSHSSKIQIKSHTETQIYISGNPTKFLQGHNLFGTNDLIYLMGKFFR